MSGDFFVPRMAMIIFTKTICDEINCGTYLISTIIFTL